MRPDIVSLPTVTEFINSGCSFVKMASARHVEVDAAKFLHKLIQDSKDEPAKLAMKLYVILQHMKLSGKEQSLPYQVISRAMETVISQHGLDIDALKSSRLPLASGAQIGDPSVARLKDKDASDSSAPIGGMEMFLRGGSTGASHAASTSKMKDDDQGNSVENEMINQEPSAVSNRAPGGSGRVESTGHDVHQGTSSQRNAKLFEHESPASLGMEDSRSGISCERLDTTKLDKQVGQGENKKPGSKRKKVDSAVDAHLENPQQFDAPSNGINIKKAKMVTKGDTRGSSSGKVNEVSSGALSSYPEAQQASASPGAEVSASVFTREVVDHSEGISHSIANTQKGNETLGLLNRESIPGKSGSMEISTQRNTKPTDVERISGSHGPVSLSVPFKEHHLKQLRAQCLVFLAFRNNLPPRKLHLEIALGDNYSKEGSTVDGIPIGDMPSKEPVNGHEITLLSTNPTSIRGSEKEMLPPRTPPFSSSSGSPVEIGASSKGTEITKKLKNKKGQPSDQPSVSEENKHLYAARVKPEAEMRIPVTVDSQTAMARQLESSFLVNSGKNDVENGAVLSNQTFSSVLRTSRQLEPQMITLTGSGTLNDASKETEKSTQVDGGHLQEKMGSPFHQLQSLKHGDRVSIFHKGKDVEHDYFRHIVKPPGDISMYSRHLGHMEKFPAILPGVYNNSMDDRGISSANYTTTEKWIMYQQKRKLLDEQNWSLKQRKTNERISERLDKLKENVSSCEDISIRTRSVIELKKLRLLQVQRRLRSDFLHDFFKPITSDMERLKSFKKQRHGRRMKQHEKLEHKMKEERQKRIRERQKEFFSEIEAHKEKMEDFFKVKRERWKGFNRYVKEFHKRKEKTHREKIDRIQREKINLLKINDVEGYLRMVQDAKSDRVKQLLKETEKYLQKLGSKLQEAKAMARQFEMEMDDNRAFNSLEKNEIAVDNEDDSDQAQHYLESNEKYYLMAHSIKESINEQPASLEGGKLREYQMNGLRWLVSLYNNNLNGILADEMGLGKTVQVISLMCYLIESKNDRGPFLVVVPSSVLPGWESEINFWAPSMAKIVYFGPPEVRRRLYREKIIHQKFNVLLTTYEYLMNKNDRPKLSKIHWHYIIIDEGHRIKNASCKLNSDLKHYQSSHRLLLTGTPLQNNIDELWALLNFLLPNIFNSSEDFSQWFSKPFENSGDNSPDEALLSEEENLLIINRLHQVLRPFVLRRLKQKVANELPEKIERLIRCEASSYQKLLMKRVEDNLGSIGTSKGRSVHNSVMELRNICNHPYLSQLHTEEVHSLIPMHYLPPIVRLCGKLELLDRLLPKLKATDHRVLLFSTMTRLLDIMEEYLSWKGYRYLRLDGHTSGNERGALIEEFNRPDSASFIFLLSIRAGGVGVNLQAADTVIIFDTDWNPQVDLQAQARAHRLGQKKDVLVLRLETVNTVEEQVRAAAEYKLGVANQSITAGFFDNNTSAEDRREYLESLLRECKKEEAALVLDDDALNDLIARSESEIDIFESVDKQRHEEEMAAWKRLQERSKDVSLVLPSRLITDEDLSEFYKVLAAYEASKVMEKRKTDVGELDIQLYGRGKRAREVRSYEDQWTEEEFEKLCQADSPEPPALKEVAKEVTDNPCVSDDANGSKPKNIEIPKEPSEELLPSSSKMPVPLSLEDTQPSSSKAPSPSLKVPPPLASKELVLSIEALLPSKEILFPSEELPEPSKQPLPTSSNELILLPSKESVPQPSKELLLPPSKQCLPPPSEASQMSSKEQLPPPSECPHLPSKEPLNNEPTPPIRRGRGRPKRVPMDASHSPRVLPMPSEAVKKIEIGSRREILPGSDNSSAQEVPSGNTQHQLIQVPGSLAYSEPTKSSVVKGQGRKTPGGSGKSRGRGRKQSSNSPSVASEIKPLSMLPNEINSVADTSPRFASSQDVARLRTRASNAPTVNFGDSPVSALQKPADMASLTQEGQKSQACALDKMGSKIDALVLEVKACTIFETKSAPSTDHMSSIAPQMHDNVKTNLIKSGREQIVNQSPLLDPEKHSSTLPMLDRRETEQVFPIYDVEFPAFGKKSTSTVYTSLVEVGKKKNDNSKTNSVKGGQKMSCDQSPTATQEKEKSAFPVLGKMESERMHPASEATSAALEIKPSPSSSLIESKRYDGSKLSRMQVVPERIVNSQNTTVASMLAVDLLERENIQMVLSEMTSDGKLKDTWKPSPVPTSQTAVASVPSNAVLTRSSFDTGNSMELHMVKTVEVSVQQGNVHSEMAHNMSSEAIKNEASPVAVLLHQKQPSVDKSKKKPSAKAKQVSEQKASVSEEKTAYGSKQSALTGLDYLLGLEHNDNDNTGTLRTTLDGQGSGRKQLIITNSKECNIEVQHPVTVSVVKSTASSEYPMKIDQKSDAIMVGKKDLHIVIESSPQKEAKEANSVADAKLGNDIHVVNPQDVHSDQSVKDRDFSIAVPLSQTLIGVSSEGKPQQRSRDDVVSLATASFSDSQQSEAKKEPLSKEALGRGKDSGLIDTSGKSKIISEGVRQTPRRRTRASSETMPSDTYPPIEKRVTRSAGRIARTQTKVNESELNKDRSHALHKPDTPSKVASLVRSIEMVNHMPVLSMPAMASPLPTEVVANNQFVVSDISAGPICISSENSHGSGQLSQESMKIDNAKVATCSHPAVAQEHSDRFPESVSSDRLPPATTNNFGKDPAKSSKDLSQFANVNLQDVKACPPASNVSQKPKASKRESSFDMVGDEETYNSCSNATEISTNAGKLKEISVKEDHLGLKDFVANAEREGAAVFKKPVPSDQFKEALADDSCGIVTREGNDSKGLSQVHTDCCMEESHPPGFGPLEETTCDKASAVGVKVTSSSDSCSNAIESRLYPTGFGHEMFLTKVGVEINVSGSATAEEFTCPEKPSSATDVEVRAADSCFAVSTDGSTDLRQLSRQKDPVEDCADAAISVDSVVQEEGVSCKKLASTDASTVAMPTVPAIATPMMIEDDISRNAICVHQGPLTESALINVIDVPTVSNAVLAIHDQQADSGLKDCDLAGSPCAVDLFAYLQTSAPGNSMPVPDTEPGMVHSVLGIKSSESVIKHTDFSSQKHTVKNETHTKNSNVLTQGCSESITVPPENAAEQKPGMLNPNATEHVSDGHNKSSPVNAVARADSSIVCGNANKADDGQSEEPCLHDSSRMFVSQTIDSEKYVTTTASVDAAAIDNVSSGIPFKADCFIEASHTEYPNVHSTPVEKDGNLIHLVHAENTNLSTISLELATDSVEMDVNTDLSPDVVVSELNTKHDGREDGGSHISEKHATALASDLYTEQDVNADDSAFHHSKAPGVIISVENMKMLDGAVGPGIATVALSSDQNTKCDGDLMEATCDGSGVPDACVSATVLPSIASECSSLGKGPTQPVPGTIVAKEDSSLLEQEQLTKKAADNSVDHAAVVANLFNNDGPVDVFSAGIQVKEPPTGHVVVSMTSMTMASNKDIEQDDNLLAVTFIGSKSQVSIPLEHDHPFPADESCGPCPIMDDCQECPVLGAIESDDTCMDSCSKGSELVERKTQADDFPAHSDTKVGSKSIPTSMDEDVPEDASRHVAEERGGSPGKTGLFLTSSLREAGKANTFSGNIIKPDDPLQIPPVSDSEKDAMDADTDQPTSLFLKDKDGQVEDSYERESMVMMSNQDYMDIPLVQNEGEEASIQNTSQSSSLPMKDEEKLYGRLESNNCDEPMHVACQETKDREPSVEDFDFSTPRKQDGKVDSSSENDPAMDNPKADPVNILLFDSKKNIASERNWGTSFPVILRMEDGKVDVASIEEPKLHTHLKEMMNMPMDVAEDKPGSTGSIDLHLSPPLRAGAVLSTSGNDSKVSTLSDKQFDVSKVSAEETEASIRITCSLLSPPLRSSDYDRASEKLIIEMDMHQISDKGKETTEEHGGPCSSPYRIESKVDDRPKEDCKIGFEGRDASARHADSSLPLVLRLGDAEANESSIDNPKTNTNFYEQNATSGAVVGEKGASTGISASSLIPALREEDEAANGASPTDSEGTFHTGEPVIFSSRGKETTESYREPFLPPLREEVYKVNDISEENAEVFSKELEECERHASLSLVPSIRAEADIDNTSKDRSLCGAGSEGSMTMQLSEADEKGTLVGTEDLSSTVMQKDDKVIGSTCEVVCMVGSEEKETSKGNANLLLDEYEKIEDVNVSDTCKDLVPSTAPGDPITLQLSGAEEKEASMGSEDLSVTSLKGDQGMVDGEASKNSRLDMNPDDLMGILKTGSGGKESSSGILQPYVSALLNIGDEAVNNTPKRIFKLCTTSDDLLGIPLVHGETISGNEDPSSCHVQGKEFKVEGKSNKNFEAGSREREESTGNADYCSLPLRVEDEEVSDSSKKDLLWPMDSDGSLETSYVRTEREVKPAGNADSPLSPGLKGEDKVDGSSGKNFKVVIDSSIQVGAADVGAGEKEINNIDDKCKMFCTVATGSDQLDISSAGVGSKALSGAQEYVYCSYSLGEENYKDPSGKDLSIMIKSDDPMDVPELESKEKAPKETADLAASTILTVEGEKANSLSGDDSIQNICFDHLTGPVVESELKDAKAGIADPLESQIVEDEKNFGPFGKDYVAIVKSNNKTCAPQTGAEEIEALSANADSSLPLPPNMENKMVVSSFGSSSDVLITLQAVPLIKEATTEDAVSSPSLPSRDECEVVCSPLCKNSNLIVDSNDSVGTLRAGAEDAREGSEGNANLAVPTLSTAEKKTDDSNKVPVVGADDKIEVFSINSSFDTSISGIGEKEKLSIGMSRGSVDQSAAFSVKEDDCEDESSTVEEHTSSVNLSNTLHIGVEDKVSLERHEDPLFPLTTRDRDLAIDDVSLNLKSEDLMDVCAFGSKRTETSTECAVPSSFPSKNEGTNVNTFPRNVDNRMIICQVAYNEEEEVAGNANSSSSEEAAKIDGASEQRSVENKNTADQMADDPMTACQVASDEEDVGNANSSLLEEEAQKIDGASEQNTVENKNPAEQNADDPMVVCQFDEKAEVLGNANSSSSEEEAAKIDGAFEQRSVENKNPADQMADDPMSACQVASDEKDVGNANLFSLEEEASKIDGTSEPSGVDNKNPAEQMADDLMIICQFDEKAEVLGNANSSSLEEETLKIDGKSEQSSMENKNPAKQMADDPMIVCQFDEKEEVVGKANSSSSEEAAKFDGESEQTSVEKMDLADQMAIS